MAIEKTPERAAAGSNPLLAQLCNGLLKRQVWMLSNHSQDLGRKLFKRRNASAKESQIMRLIRIVPRSLRVFASSISRVMKR